MCRKPKNIGFAPQRSSPNLSTGFHRNCCSRARKRDWPYLYIWHLHWYCYWTVRHGYIICRTHADLHRGVCRGTGDGAGTGPATALMRQLFSEGPVDYSDPFSPNFHVEKLPELAWHPLWPIIYRRSLYSPKYVIAFVVQVWNLSAALLYPRPTQALSAEKVPATSHRGSEWAPPASMIQHPLYR